MGDYSEFNYELKLSNQLPIMYREALIKLNDSKTIQETRLHILALYGYDIGDSIGVLYHSDFEHVPTITVTECDNNLFIKGVSFIKEGQGNLETVLNVLAPYIDFYYEDTTMRNVSSQGEVMSIVFADFLTIDNVLHYLSRDYIRCNTVVLQKVSNL